MTTATQDSTGKAAGDAAAAVASEAAAAAEVADAIEGAAVIDYATLGPEALGRFAHAIVGNPAVQLAVQEVKREWGILLFTSQPIQTAEREAIYYQVRALDALMAKLDRISSAGRAAAIHAKKLA